MDDFTLTASEELALAARIRSGDLAARDELAAANDGLAIALADRYAGRGLDVEDLVQEARIALLVAADAFAPEVHATRFVQYAGKCVRGHLSRYVRNNGRLVRVPYKTQYAVRDFEAERARMEDEGGGQPTFDAVADRLGVPPSRRAILRAALEAPNPASLSESEAPVSSETDPHARVELDEDLSALDVAIRRLSRFERWVISRRYRLDDKAGERRRMSPGRESDDGEPRPYRHIAAECGLSAYLVRRIEAEALAKLRAELDPDAPDSASLVLAFRERAAGPMSRRSKCA